MNRIRLEGDGGAQILWGYRIAVTIGAWSLQQDPGPAEAPAPGAWVFTGDVRTCDLVAARQRPLTLVIPRKAGSWRWAIRELTVSSTHLVAQLGPKEASSYVAVRAAGNGQAGSERR